MTDTVIEIMKRSGCRLVKLDSGDSMIIPLAVLKKAPLAVGQAVCQAQYRARVLPMEGALALEHAGRMLMARDRTEAEIRKKLESVGYQAQTVDQTLQRLVNARLVDDSRFLTNYINMKIKRTGVIRIRRELHMKGIAPEAIEAALAEADSSAQLDAALKHAKKALSKKTDDPRHQANLAYAALARRGFPPHIIKQALALAREGLQEQEADGFPG